MPCDTRLKTGQTITERKDEVRRAASAIDRLIAARAVTVRTGPNGAVTFVGIPDSVRDGLTDACIYRRIMATGSAASKQALARVNPATVRQGVHSHDGGVSWHGRG